MDKIYEKVYKQNKLMLKFKRFYTFAHFFIRQ